MRPAQRRGAALTEYILIIALVAIATIGVILGVSGELRDLIGVGSTALAGEENEPRAAGVLRASKIDLKTFAAAAKAAPACGSTGCF